MNNNYYAKNKNIHRLIITIVKNLKHNFIKLTRKNK